MTDQPNGDLPATDDAPDAIASDAVAEFVRRWQASGASERANAQAFLIELCDVLGVDHPDPATDVATADAYAFERPVSFDDGEASSTGFIDLYKRGHFVLEAKQGADAPEATEAEAKHRFFVSLEAAILPDNALVAIASDDAFHLGVLSSRFHIVWALAAGNTLEDRPRYNKNRCFEPFPFPAATPAQQAAIRALAERLDGHRKAVQADHPDLTLTTLYNVLERVLEVGPSKLTDAERDTYERGLVGVLRDLHDDLDRAVADAYGWPADIDEAEVLRRLVALNAERAAEEAQGLVRYLRPSYQNPDGGDQGALGVEVTPKPSKGKTAKAPWPKPLAERARAVQRVLTAEDRPATSSEVARRFQRARKSGVEQILDTLVALGQARQSEDGRYAA